MGSSCPCWGGESGKDEDSVESTERSGAIVRRHCGLVSLKECGLRRRESNVEVGVTCILGVQLRCEASYFALKVARIYVQIWSSIDLEPINICRGGSARLVSRLPILNHEDNNIAKETSYPALHTHCTVRGLVTLFGFRVS